MRTQETTRTDGKMPIKRGRLDLDVEGNGLKTPMPFRLPHMHWILLLISAGLCLANGSCASPPQREIGAESNYVSLKTVQMIPESSGTDEGGGARVENLVARQEGLDALLTYDLIGAGDNVRDEVILDISLDDGKTWKRPKGLWGDLGKGIGVGKGKRIHWAAMEEFPDGLDAIVRFRLLAATERDRPSSARRKEITECLQRDGSFCKLRNGMVLDTNTGLMWASQDNGRDIDWTDAKNYCENYRGGGYTDWRMPTMDELAGLYDESKRYKISKYSELHITDLIRLSAGRSWASDSDGSRFTFTKGHLYLWGHTRALPVRTNK